MSGSCSTLDQDLLSAYLDRELDRAEIDDLENHLEACPHCQRQLDGLVKVTGALRSLERVAPPPILDELVLGRREIRGARSWSERLDTLMSSTQKTRSTIGPIFAIVMMLVLLVFFFSDALVKRSNRPVVISVPSSVKFAIPDDPWSRPSRVLANTGQRFVAVFGVGGDRSGLWTNFAQREGVAGVWLEQLGDDSGVATDPPESGLLEGTRPFCVESQGLLPQELLLPDLGGAEKGPIAVLEYTDSGLVCRQFSLR